jgi:hypothetical protein
MHGIQAKDCFLLNSDLSGADLRAADLRNRGTLGYLGTLFLTKFCDANLEGAKFKNNQLSKADLTGANLHGVGKKARLWSLIPFYRAPFIVDNTRIAQTRFDPRTADPWSVLRRSYTGSSMFFVLLFTLASFAPLWLQAVYWIGVGRVEGKVIAASVSAMREAVSLLRQADLPAWQEWVAKAEKAVGAGSNRFDREEKFAGASLSLKVVASLLEEASRIADIDENRADVASRRGELANAESLLEQARYLLKIVSPTGRFEVEEKRVYELLIRNRNERGLLGVLSAALILYNLVRFYLTRRVGQIRDAEERSGNSPNKSDYWFHWWLHRLISPLFGISFAYGGYRLVQAMSATVILVNRTVG